MEKDWVKIYSTEKPYKAELLKGVLEENNIDSIIINKQDSSVGFGEAELYVAKVNALKAVNIIKKHSDD